MALRPASFLCLCVHAHPLAACLAFASLLVYQPALTCDTHALEVILLFHYQQRLLLRLQLCWLATDTLLGGIASAGHGIVLFVLWAVTGHAEVP